MDLRRLVEGGAGAAGGEAALAARAGAFQQFGVLVLVLAAVWAGVWPPVVLGRPFPRLSLALQYLQFGGPESLNRHEVPP